MTHEQARGLIAQRFESEALPALQEQALRAHLRGCAECRACYDRYAEAEVALEAADGPSAGQLDRLRASGPRMPAQTSRRLVVWVALGAVAAAALLLALVLVPRDEPEFVTRGGEAGKGAWIRVFARRDGVTMPAARIKATDGLLFSYSVEREADYGWVAIAGRDAHGDLHWFHPAFEKASDTPMSVPVERGVADRELPVVVYSDLAPGPLEVCAMFSIKQLDVKVIDGWHIVADDWYPNTHTSCVKLTVE